MCTINDQIERTKQFIEVERKKLAELKVKIDNAIDGFLRDTDVAQGLEFPNMTDERDYVFSKEAFDFESSTNLATLEIGMIMRFVGRIGRMQTLQKQKE